MQVWDMFWRDGIHIAPNMNPLEANCVEVGIGTHRYPSRDEVAFIKQQDNLLMRLLFPQVICYGPS